MDGATSRAVGHESGTAVHGQADTRSVHI